MANQIPSDITAGDMALLAPVVIDAARSHAGVLDRFLTKKLGKSWQGELTRRASALDDAIEKLAKEERETRELSKDIDEILGRVPAWKRHILSLARLAYGPDHPKHAQYLSDLGRGKRLATSSIGPARQFLQAVNPEVAAHRDDLLAAGGDADEIDRGAHWAKKLADLKTEATREKREDSEARSAVNKAYDALIIALNWTVDAANASEFSHPETEAAIAQALDEGYRKIRQRTAGKGDEPDDKKPTE